MIAILDGTSPVPVAVKQLPLGAFPLTIALDDSNAMMPERLLSSLKQIKVRVRISPNGSIETQSGEWYGESELQDFNGNSQVSVQIDRQIQ